MRIESSVTSVSWIPSEAIGGMLKAPFELGVTHYDEPPPEAFDDLGALRQADRFRFANDLRAFVEVERGKITNHGAAGPPEGDIPGRGPARHPTGAAGGGGLGPVRPDGRGAGRHPLTPPR